MPTCMPRFPRLARLISLSVLTGVMIGGCSSVDPFGPSIQVSLVGQQPIALDPVLEVEVGSSRISLRGADVPLGRANGVIHVRGYDEQPARVTMLSGQSDTLASVGWSLNLQPGYEYGIAALVTRTRPMGTCVGSVIATPLRNSPSDTLFVMYVAMRRGGIC